MKTDDLSAASKLVVFVSFPGVQMLDLIGPLEIFAGANEFVRRMKPPASTFYSLQIVSADGRSVRASNNLTIEAQHSTSWLPGKLDTLVVPGALTIDGAVNHRQLVPWIRKISPRARRTAAICSGAFLLAEAGLLNGRKATTHWAGCERLRRNYPAVMVDPEPIFVRDGPIYTSAGVTAGMDLALALVEEDLGRQAALELARWFVMFLIRPGGQAQFSTQLQSQFSGSPALQKLLNWMHDHPADDLSVEALAGKVGMSPRHFARIFVRELGITPALQVQKIRLERARRELVESQAALKTIAGLAGFGSEESLRRVFQQCLGVTPGEYRKRFQRMAS